MERPSYWPDPKPDCTISPCAGGEVPTARSLASALDDAPPGETLVVCQDDSMARLNAAIDKARTDGYFNRPTDHQDFSEAEATQLLEINEALFDRCEYDEIQPAVTAAGNNDRVVVMPGLYEEPTARSTADVRPGLRPVRDPGGERRPRRAEPRLPVPLPERRQPRRRDRSRAGHRPAAHAAEGEPARHPEPGAVHPVQPPARGLRRQRRRRGRRGR